MGVLNVTPDSFSDGGRFASTAAAVAHGLRLAEAGADILDVGGESTRPGAEPAGLQEELERVAPVIEALARRTPARLSVDTMKPEVAAAAAAAGATIWNDVNALRAEGALELAARLDLEVVLMHMQGAPRTMQQAPSYADVVAEVEAFLRARVEAAIGQGVALQRIWIDPGIGFGKTLQHNLALLRGCGALKSALGRPICIGVSRKSFISAIEVEAGGSAPAAQARLAGSLAAGLFALDQGADMLRVHDVAETRQAVRVWAALRGNGR